MDTVLIFLGFFILIVGVGAAIAAFFEKKRSVLFFTLLLAFFGFLTIICQRGKEIENEETLKAKDSIINNRNILLQKKTDSIKDLTTQLWYKSIGINVKQDSLIKKQQELILTQYKSLSITQNVLDNSIGGKGNKPVLMFYLVPERTHNRLMVRYGLMNYGNFPLNNINLILADQYTVQTDILEAQGKYNVSDIDTSYSLTLEEVQKTYLLVHYHQKMVFTIMMVGY